MDLGISGKTTLVVGGTSNLGRECVNSLANDKANIFLFARGAEGLERTADEVSKAYGVKVWTCAGDMKRKEDVERLKAEIEAIGGLDILVMNTGRAPSPMKLVLEETDEERWREAYETQLKAAIMVVGTLAPLIVQRGWGRIIAITSASVKQPMDRHVLSTVFRTGFTAFLKHLANELAHTGVTVNCVCPASILTDALRKYYDLEARAQSVPMKRLGTPTELAGAVAFFASKQAGFITGASLQVDGGMTAALI